MNQIITLLITSLEQKKKNAQQYLNLFLAISLGPDSSSYQSKPGTKSRMPKRSVYIPGETQEQRRLKRKSLQNGSILACHMIMERYADYEQQISEFLENMDENDYMQSFLYFVDYVENDVVGGLEQDVFVNESAYDKTDDCYNDDEEDKCNDDDDYLGGDGGFDDDGDGGIFDVDRGDDDGVDADDRDDANVHGMNDDDTSIN